MARKTRVPKDLPISSMYPHVFRPFSPRTDAQRYLVQAIKSSTLVVVQGAAGTGKTALCTQTSLEMVFDEDHAINKLVIVRLICDTHGEHLGALPGEKMDKLFHFAAPVLDNLQQVMPSADIEALIADRTIEVLPVSHVLGRTFVNTAVVVEEAQNLDDSMVLLLLTRIGKGSVMMLNGDPEQAVIGGRNGIHYAARLVEGLAQCAVVRLPESDIQRHPVVKAVLARAKELTLQTK